MSPRYTVQVDGFGFTLWDRSTRSYLDKTYKTRKAAEAKALKLNLADVERRRDLHRARVINRVAFLTVYQGDGEGEIPSIDLVGELRVIQGGAA